MKIALIGYGKMGRTIEEIALNRGHEIVIRIDVDNQHEFSAPVIQKANVAIEFTGPHSAFENVKKCIEYNVPVICGSTGWTDKLEQIKKLNAEKKGHSCTPAISVLA